MIEQHTITSSKVKSFQITDIPFFFLNMNRIEISDKQNAKKTKIKEKLK